MSDETRAQRARRTERDIAEILSDERRAALYAALIDLDAIEDEEYGGRTWMDGDPSVAPDDEESWHGRTLAMMESVGWDSCYHERGHRYRLHYRVKLDGMGRWRGFRDRLDEIERERGEGFDAERIETIAQHDEEWERESGFDEARYTLADLSAMEPRGVDIWSCGRQGGYLNVGPHEWRDVRAMLFFGSWIAERIEAMNSREAGEWIADTALERYDDEKFGELASPRSAADIDLALVRKGSR